MSVYHCSELIAWLQDAKKGHGNLHVVVQVPDDSSENNQGFKQYLISDIGIVNAVGDEQGQIALYVREQTREDSEVMYGLARIPK